MGSPLDPRVVDGGYVPILGGGESKEHAVRSRILCIDLYFEGPASWLARPATAGDVVTLSALEECWSESKTRQPESGEDAPA